jgi:hypothetical protein
MTKACCFNSHNLAISIPEKLDELGGGLRVAQRPLIFVRFVRINGLPDGDGGGHCP